MRFGNHLECVNVDKKLGLYIKQIKLIQAEPLTPSRKKTTPFICHFISQPYWTFNEKQTNKKKLPSLLEEKV